MQEDSVCSFIADLGQRFALFPMDCFSPMKGETTWPEEKLGGVAGEDAVATASSGSKSRLLRNVFQNVNAYKLHLKGL